MNKEIRRFSNFSALPVLLFVLSWRFTALLVQAVTMLLDRTLQITLPTEAITFAGYTLLYPVGGGLALLVFYKLRGRETGLRLRQVFCKPQRPVGWIIRWCVIIWGLGLQASLLTNFVLSLLQRLLHFRMDAPRFDTGDGTWGIAVLLFALSLYAPLIEELLFRSAVYRHTEIMGQGFAIVFSALMFALMHGNLNQLLYTFVIGAGFAYLFAKTRSLIPSLLLHFCINTTTVVFSSIVTNADDAEALMRELRSGNLIKLAGTAGYSSLMYGLMVAATVFGIIELVRLIRNRDFLRGGVFPLPIMKKTLVFYTAPVTVITFAVMLFFLVLNTVQSIQ